MNVSDRTNRVLSSYKFSDKEITYVDSHSGFTFRDMANVQDWFDGLNPTQKVKLADLTVAQQVAVFQLSDEAKEIFWHEGFNNPVTFGVKHAA